MSWSSWSNDPNSSCSWDFLSVTDRLAIQNLPLATKLIPCWMYLVRAGCCISSRQVVRLKASYSTATSRKTDTVLSLVKEGKIQRALDHFMEDPSDCLGACALLRNLGKSGDIDTALHVYRHYANDLIPDNEMMTIVLGRLGYPF